MDFVKALEDVAPGDAERTRPLVAPRAALAGSIPPTRRVPAKSSLQSKAALAAVGMVAVALGAWGVLQLTGSPASSPPPVTPGAVDTGRVEAVSPSPATPPPAPPAAQLPSVPGPAVNPVAGAGDTLVLPEPEDFDAPGRRLMAIRIAGRILANEKYTRLYRARAAALLADEALQRRNRVDALRWYLVADSLYPSRNYADMIQQLRDTTPS